MTGTEALRSPPALTASMLQNLYREHAGVLCAYLTRCLRGDTAEAEGIVQEAFLKAWERRGSLRSPAAFRPWLYSIAMNVLRQRKRKLRPVAVEDPQAVSHDPSPERHVQASRELDAVLAALGELPDEQREAVLLVRMQGLKFRQAAEQLDVPESTVKTRVRRALLRLADCLDEPG